MLPEPLKVYDLSALEKICKEYLELVESGGYDDDIQHYIFEAALETIYGPDIWKWGNKLCQ